MQFVIKPVLFNSFKHHLNFIRERINQVNTINDFNKLLSEINIIGSSQMDVYSGYLNPKNIADYILEKIKKDSNLTREKYIKWLNYPKTEYRVIKIIDNSNWVCRLGVEDIDRFVHIHPARNSYLTFRVKANSLKAAVLILAKIKLDDLKEINEELIYDIRINYLNLSPVKSIDKLNELYKLISIINY